MKQQKALTQFQEQQRTKPVIEDFVLAHLDGDLKKAVLGFAEHLRAKQMPPVWSSWNGWKSNYKSKNMCAINIPLGIFDVHTWSVIPNLMYLSEYEDFIISAGLQQMIWDHVFYCVHNEKSGYAGKGCSPQKGCAGGVTRVILGKEIRGLCKCRPNPVFSDPDETTIAGIKHLLELEQEARALYISKN